MTKKQRMMIADTLSNNETSSDRELLRWFVDEVKITPEQARKALKQRTWWLITFPTPELYTEERQ